ncbi:hypothetical protein TMatcc_005271 [Talaromyces marneffei ATCC 18224]
MVAGSFPLFRCIPSSANLLSLRTKLSSGRPVGLLVSRTWLENSPLFIACFWKPYVLPWPLSKPPPPPKKAHPLQYFLSVGTDRFCRRTDLLFLESNVYVPFFLSTIADTFVTTCLKTVRTEGSELVEERRHRRGGID